MCDYERTSIVEFELWVGGENRGEEADRGLVGLPVRHGCGSEVRSVDVKKRVR